MKILPFLLLLVITAMVMACEPPASGESTQEFESQQMSFEKVIELHDEVMAQQGTLDDLQQQLSGVDAATNPQLASQNAEIVARLSASHRAMMDWMHNFNPNVYIPAAREGNPEEYAQFLADRNITHEEYMSYLDDQLAEMKDIRELTSNSIAAARTQLEYEMAQ